MTSSTSLHAGQRIRIHWGGEWYPGRVVRLNDNGTVYVHYDGWSDGQDADVRRSDLRLP